MSQPDLSTPSLEADFLAVDGTNLYWSVFHEGMSTAVNRGPKADPASAVTPVASMEFQPVAVTVGTNVYWSQYKAGGAIRSAPTTATDAPTDFVSSEDQVLFVLPVNNDLYWSYRGATDPHGGVKKWVGGTITEIARDENAPSGIALDASDVYWVCQDGTMRKAPRTGGSPPPAPTELGPYEGPNLIYAEIAVDNQFVYWTGLHTVWQVPKDKSSAPLDFDHGSWLNVRALKMDGRVLYWTTGTAAQLMRKVKRAP
jgi:hypothetical protein